MVTFVGMPSQLGKDETEIWGKYKKLGLCWFYAVCSFPSLRRSSQPTWSFSVPLGLSHGHRRVEIPSHHLHSCAETRGQSVRGSRWVWQTSNKASQLASQASTWHFWCPLRVEGFQSCSFFRVVVRETVCLVKGSDPGSLCSLHCMHERQP